MEQQSKLVLTPILQIEVGNVARVTGLSVGKASNLLNNPETRQILTKALEQAFHETVDRVVKELARIPMESFPTVRDEIIKLPALPTLEHAADIGGN